MEEVPNLNYINQLSAGDQGFRDEIVAVIKSELIEESQIYENHMANRDYGDAADAVHKIKHKIGILGMAKCYHLAEDFEEDLRQGGLDLQQSFGKILRKILTFSKNL